jgi:cleavage and polyadenylation specificity factor subunit 1
MLTCLPHARDVPYTPSFVLPLSDLSDNIKNVKDFTFLAGFNNPTICLLFCPTPTFVGRYSSVRDTFQLEIRTLDLNGKTYASLTTVRDLPSDCQYIIPCPSRFGGVLVVAETSIIHIDQSGNTVCAAVNGWFSSISGRTAVDRDHMNLELELDDSRLTWLGNDAEADQALLILKDGTVHQLGLKLEGRAVSKIEISAPISQRLVIPSAAADVAGKGVFVACAVGDSVLARVEMHELKLENGHVEEERTQALSAQKDAMDEDLEGELLSLHGTKAPG